MDRSWRGAVISLALVLSVSAGACGSSGRGASSPPSSDPALEAAAHSIEPFLAKSFPDSFSGLELDHSHHVLLIYRRPDPRLDAAVKGRIPQVHVVVRDGKFSLKQMKQLADQIMADKGYWRTRGINIQSVGPISDGSGVLVGTSRGAADTDKLARRYGAGVLTVEKVDIVLL
jgi:hypothetical protein